MLESQDSVAEQFNKIRFSKKNPSNLYKVHKKFGDKLYLARRKTDSVLFMIKSVTESYLEEEVKEESFESRKQSFNNELVALKKVTGPNIISICDVFKY